MIICQDKNYIFKDCYILNKIARALNTTVYTRYDSKKLCEFYQLSINSSKQRSLLMDYLDLYPLYSSNYLDYLE
jgi:hypothetical protein